MNAPNISLMPQTLASRDHYLEECARSDVAEIDTEDVPQCNVCGGAGFDTFATGYDYELQTCRNLWRFVRCAKCGHVWLNPRPAVAALPIIYPPTYYAYNYSTQINAIAVRGKAMLDRLKMRSIWRRLERSPQSYVDVGCGDGRFLKLMQRQGIPPDHLYGLDLDQPTVDELRRYGYQAHCCRVEDCSAIPAASIDVATNFPDATMAGARSCKDGFLRTMW